MQCYQARKKTHCVVFDHMNTNMTLNQYHTVPAVPHLLSSKVNSESLWSIYRERTPPPRMPRLPTCEEWLNWWLKKTHTHTLLHWFQLWSQPARCRVAGWISFEKTCRSLREAVTDSRLSSDYEREQCAADKQALTSQTGTSKTFETYNNTKTRQASLSSACAFPHVYWHRQPHTISPHCLLHAVLCTSVPIEAPPLLSKRR